MCKHGNIGQGIYVPRHLVLPIGHDVGVSAEIHDDDTAGERTCS